MYTDVKTATKSRSMPGEMVAKRCIVTASRLRSVASENASTDRHGDLPVEEDTLVITQRYILCGVCIFPSSANSSWWRNGSEDRQSGRMETNGAPMDNDLRSSAYLSVHRRWTYCSQGTVSSFQSSYVDTRRVLASQIIKSSPPQSSTIVQWLYRVTMSPQRLD